MTIKRIANYITIARILGSFLLIFIEPFSALFFIIYILCGASDILDGYIARKLNTISTVGQILDSIADIIFVGTILFIFIPVLQLSLWTLCWISMIAIIRILSIFVGYKKYAMLCLLHTYTNKITGIALFSFIFLYQFCGENVATIIICSIASISAIEELAINILSKKLDRDIKFFSIKQP